MKKYHTAFISTLVLISLIIVSQLVMARTFRYPLGPAGIAASGDHAGLDMAGVIAGARRVAADVAWVQLLQYYGTAEAPVDKDEEFESSWELVRFFAGLPPPKAGHDEENCHDPRHHHNYDGGVYPDFLSYASRVTALDPFFAYANLYGAGALAWNLNRPDEAVKLLENAIAAMEGHSPNITRDIHQPFWQYHLYLSALIYRNAGETGKMVSLLETAVAQPRCPNMVKAILANIYQKDGKHLQALKLWLDIYDSNDPTYRAHAEKKISELKDSAI